MHLCTDKSPQAGTAAVNFSFLQDEAIRSSMIFPLLCHNWLPPSLLCSFCNNDSMLMRSTVEQCIQVTYQRKVRVFTLSQ